LVAGAIAWEWLNRRLGWNRPLDPAACRRLTLVGGAALLASLVGPCPLDRLRYPFRPELTHPIMRVFAEMQPLHHFVLRPPYTTNLAYTVAFCALLTVAIRFRHYRLWEVGLLAGLAFLGNFAYRSVPDWIMVTLALAVPHLAVLRRELARWLAARKQERSRSVAVAAASAFLRAERVWARVLDNRMLRFQWFWLAAGLGVLALVSLFPPLGRRVPDRQRAEVPTRAVDWMAGQGLAGRFFAPADYGSYLCWRLGDRARSYVDTRGFFFPPQLLEDCHYLPQLAADWQQRLDRVFDYGTDYFFLETTGPRGEFWRRLQPVVGDPLYLDDQCVLLTAAQVRDGIARMEKASERWASAP
jgi:hypothetical protein